MKQRCAKEALKRIKNHSIVGLGGGRTIAYLIDEIANSDLQVKIVTPSFASERLCLEKGLHVLPTHSVSHVDVAFDGCDEVDLKLHALKSGGGIHTREKIIGSMADQYILLVDELKVHQTLAFTHPVVLEVVKDALNSVINQVEKLGGNCNIREASNKDGGLISDQSLLLVDATFSRVDDVEALYEALIKIVGILEVSLFVNEVDEVIVVKEDGFEYIKK